RTASHAPQWRVGHALRAAAIRRDQRFHRQAHRDPAHTMKIVGADLSMLRIPLRTTFRTALRTVEQVEDVVLRLYTDDGRVGHGSAPATPQITGDTHASIIAALRQAILPRLLAGQPRELSALLADVQGAPHGNVSARCAAEVA